MGGVNQPRVENTITIGSAHFSYCSDFNTCLEAQNSFNVFSKYSNAPWRHLCTKLGILAPHRLFILQFIFNKTTALTLFWNASYHNTPIYHINKKKYNTTLQLTY